MSVAHRLAQYIIDSGLNINQVTVRCGLTPGALNKAIKVGKGLHSDTIAAVIKAYRDLNPDWLLLGIGKMLRPFPDQLELDMSDPKIAKLIAESDRIQAQVKEYLRTPEAQQKLKQEKVAIREKQVQELGEELYTKLKTELLNELRAEQERAVPPKRKKAG